MQCNQTFADIFNAVVTKNGTSLLSG